MIRDEEINRLIKYAQGLNTTVKIKQTRKSDGDAAEWSIDGSEIVVYTTPKTSKLCVVLCLIHEIGHHLEHIHSNNRELDEKLSEAIDPEEEKKRHRRKIYDWEVRGSKWWETIYKETDCRFDINKLHMEKDYDLWQYEFYYENGKYPKKVDRRKKWEEIRSKYKN